LCIINNYLAYWMTYIDPAQKLEVVVQRLRYGKNLPRVEQLEVKRTQLRE